MLRKLLGPLSISLLVLGIMGAVKKNLTPVINEKRIIASEANQPERELIPIAVTDMIWDHIWRDLSKVAWAHGPMKLFFRDCYKSLRGKAFYYINKQAISDYGLDEPNALSPYAFYVPETDEIYLQKDLDSNTFERALMHELFHAFQYRYRYPFDATLSLIANKGNWERLTQHHTPPPNIQELPGILNYYYESQAHWAALALGSNTEWNQHWNQELKTSLPVSEPIPSNNRDNELLWGGLENSANFDGKSPYSSPALYDAKAGVVLAHVLDPQTIHAIHFQSHFLNQLITTYYQQQSYVYSDYRSLAAITELFNHYFTDRILKLNSHQVSSCRKVINHLSKNSKLSPFDFWKNPSGVNFYKCPLYRDVTVELLKQFQILENNFPPHTPFRKIKPGTEGSRGDFNVNASITIHPQLEVKP